MELNIGDIFINHFKVSDEVYKGFLKIFEDYNPMHTDLHFSTNYGYSDILMHGNILNGFLSNFVGEKLPIKNVVIISQEIKFNKPVYLNDVLELNVEISEIYESVNVINFKYKFQNSKSMSVAKGKIQIKILK